MSVRLIRCTGWLGAGSGRGIGANRSESQSRGGEINALPCKRVSMCGWDGGDSAASIWSRKRLTTRSAMRPTERHELSATQWAHSLHRLVSRHGQIHKNPNETGSNKSHNNVLTYSANMRSYGCRKNPTIAPANPGSDRNTQTK